jgi:photosystem II stability/assembly factor-like uncharacterized protein
MPLVSIDGGATWRLGSMSDKRVVLRYLTCPSATTCVAGGFHRRSVATLSVTTDGGATWTRMDAPDGAFSFDGVSCVSPDSCVLVTQGVNDAPVAWTTEDLGASLEPHTIPDNGYFDVDCAGQTCVAVGENGGDGAIAVSTDGGQTWGSRAVPPEAQLLGHVSCGSPTDCAATAFDYGPQAGPLVVGSTDGGTTWRPHRLPARPEQPLDVACVDASCLASDVSSSGVPLILAGRP